MNGNTSTTYLADNTAPYGFDYVQRIRQLHMLLTEAERTIQDDPYIASTCLNQAIDLLAIGRQSGPLPPRNRGGLTRWQISRIDAYINEHLDQCIRTNELAALLDLSVSHFSHAFKQTTGVTPLMYVTAARVKAARQCMLTSADSLGDIALRHGFCDQSHFCRVFRRETGLSPHIWRKLHTTKYPPQTVYDPLSVIPQGSPQNA